MKNTWSMLISTSAVVALGWLGCGGELTSVEEYAEEMQAALCDTWVRCGLASDSSVCRDAGLVGFEEAALLGVEKGTIVFDASAATECVSFLRTLSCDATSRDQRVLSQACFDALRGTLDSFDPCFSDAECISAECWEASPEDCEDVCCAGLCSPGEGVPADIGEECDDGPRPCVEGAYCAGLNCEPLKELGDACEYDSQCPYGAICFLIEEQQGVCRRTPTAGEPCMASFGFGGCASVGMICVDGNCEPLGEEEAGCEPDRRSCQIGLYCDEGAGICRRGRSPGEPCDQDSVCAPSSFCGEEEECEALKPDGAPCASASRCKSGFCGEAGTCEPAPVCGE